MENIITLVIPVFNEEDNIEDCINSILSQSELPQEVIFIDNLSTDKSKKIIYNYMKKFHCTVKLINENKRGVPFVRNRGILESNSSIVAFLDGDCIAPKDYLKLILQGFNEYDVQAVSGRYKLTGKNIQLAQFREMSWTEHFGWDLERRVVNKLNDQVGTLVSGCTAFKKRVLIDLGLFDERIRYMDDIAISEKFYKKGFKALMDPSIIIQHRIETDRLTIFRKDLYYGFDHALINKLIRKRWFKFYPQHYQKIIRFLISFFKERNNFYLYQVRTLISHKLGLLLRGISMGSLYL